jgi:DNA replication protein DnaD
MDHQNLRFSMFVSTALYKEPKMNQGWIKLYRCLLTDPIWQCSTNEQRVILVTLLLMANHAARKWQWQGKPYMCKPGQMITSLNSIRQKTGKKISIQKIRTALKRFERMGFLHKQASTHNTLITICNWDVYQAPNKPDNTAGNTPVTPLPQTPNAGLTTNKNDKNAKKVKKTTPLSFEQQDIQTAQAETAKAKAAFLDGD